MNNLMTATDLKALWHARPHPANRPPLGNPAANAWRLLDDWFPAGLHFMFLGSSCFSRGPRLCGSQVKLIVLAPAREGGLEEVEFSASEALSIAERISKDHVRWLDGLIPTPAFRLG